MEWSWSRAWILIKWAWCPLNSRQHQKHRRTTSVKSTCKVNEQRENSWQKRLRIMTTGPKPDDGLWRPWRGHAGKGHVRHRLPWWGPSSLLLLHCDCHHLPTGPVPAQTDPTSPNQQGCSLRHSPSQAIRAPLQWEIMRARALMLCMQSLLVQEL